MLPEPLARGLFFFYLHHHPYTQLHSFTSRSPRPPPPPSGFVFTPLISFRFEFRLSNSTLFILHSDITSSLSRVRFSCLFSMTWTWYLPSRRQPEIRPRRTDNRSGFFFFLHLVLYFQLLVSFIFYCPGVVVGSIYNLSGRFLLGGFCCVLLVPFCFGGASC